MTGSVQQVGGAPVRAANGIVDAAGVSTAATPVAASRRFILRRAAMLAGGTAAVAVAGVPRLALADKRASKNGQEEFFRQIQTHESDHVEFLVNALGAAARPKPTFQGLTANRTFGGFAYVAQALENTGVGAYLGAAPYINSQEYLAAAGSIATIESRHAGYLNVLHGDPITSDAFPGDADNSFEPPLTAAQVVELASPFIADLNGGPPIGYEQVSSDENDIAILNFALALEYLEREFYDLNVPRFFR